MMNLKLSKGEGEHLEKKLKACYGVKLIPAVRYNEPVLIPEGCAKLYKSRDGSYIIGGYCCNEWDIGQIPLSRRVRARFNSERAAISC